MVGILQTIIEDAKIEADEKFITDAQHYVDQKASDTQEALENITSLTEFLEGKPADDLTDSILTGSIWEVNNKGAKGELADAITYLDYAIAEAKLYINPVELRTLKTKELSINKRNNSLEKSGHAYIRHHDEAQTQP